MPPELLGAAQQGSEMLGALAGMAGPLGARGTPLGDLARGVKEVADGALGTTAAGGAATAVPDVDELAGEVAGWMERTAPGRALPDRAGQQA